MKKAIFFLLFIFTSFFAGSTETWFIGNWEGKGIQDGGLTWGMHLNVTSLSQVIVTYADLKCGGTWNFTKSKGKKKLYYTEHIEKGIENCDQGCEITVKKRGDNVIKVTFILRSFHEKRPLATAVLNRVN